MRLPRKLYLVCFRRKMRTAISSKLFNGYRFASALIETRTRSTRCAPVCLLRRRSRYDEKATEWAWRSEPDQSGKL